MLPMLAGPLGKILGVGALALALFLSGEWHGRSAMQQKFDAALANQALASAETVIAGAENVAKTVVKYIKIKGETQIVHDVIEKEIVKYVDRNTESCRLGPEFERTFDTISLLYVTPENRLPSADAPAGGADADPGATVEAAQILQAYTDAVGQLYAVYREYDALREWVRDDYAIARAGAGRRAVEDN